MTTIGEVLQRSRRDVLAAAAQQLSKTSADLKNNRVVLEQPDFGSLRDISITDLLKTGWQDVKALREAAKETVATPGTTKTVELHKLTLAWRYDPEFEVYADNIKIVTVPFACDIVIEMVELFAVVTHGCLVALKVEAMQVGLEIMAAKKTFVSESTQLIPAREIAIGHGIGLVKGASCPPRVPEQRPPGE
jgi:hypothetical protein